MKNIRLCLLTLGLSFASMGFSPKAQADVVEFLDVCAAEANCNLLNITTTDNTQLSMGNGGDRRVDAFITPELQSSLQGACESRSSDEYFSGSFFITEHYGATYEYQGWTPVQATPPTSVLVACNGEVQNNY